jgi:glyoxylase I family protein
MTEGKVLAIGGIFFKCKNPKEMEGWYLQNLGILPASGNAMWEQEKGPALVAPFSTNTKYFGDNNQSFMINLRVQNLNQLLEDLKNKNVKIDSELIEEEYGKFAWIYDPEGNKIELWEAP